MIVPAPTTSLTAALHLERPATACRFGLPTDGAAVRALAAPMSTEWGRRLRAACEGRGRQLAIKFARAA